MKNRTTYEVANYSLVVGMPEEVDHHVSLELKRGIDEQMEQHYIRNVVFDFSRTHFMDSSGVGLLLLRYKEMRSRGGEVLLWGVNRQIGRVLRLSGLNGLIPGCPPEEPQRTE